MRPQRAARAAVPRPSDAHDSKYKTIDADYTVTMFVMALLSFLFGQCPAGCFMCV
jgi:hypothetical protein